MQKKRQNIWSFQKKAVLLHAFSLEKHSPLIGTPENLLIFGESGSKAKIHMSDVVANRIEP